uniref:Ig-like domain-containing protein n=1 Tax=Neolamprologus brichardi TaxID=32507 RepID=A0A3Q4HHT8_NEOBR
MRRAKSKYRYRIDWLISLSEARKPPVFDVPLKPATLDEGEKLILRCHVCGSSPLKIQWMKDRKELTPSGSTRISFSDGTACLEISTVSKLNAGDYLCKATNEAGSEFCKAKVTVKDLYSKILFIYTPASTNSWSLQQTSGWKVCTWKPSCKLIDVFYVVPSY